MFSADLVRRNNRMIVRDDPIANFHDFLLNRVYLNDWQPMRRKNRSALLLGHSQNDVSTTQVMKIIGESTHRA